MLKDMLKTMFGAGQVDGRSLALSISSLHNNQNNGETTEPSQYFELHSLNRMKEINMNYLSFHMAQQTDKIGKVVVFVKLKSTLVPTCENKA